MADPGLNQEGKNKEKGPLGLRSWHLHMAIHGFVLKKFTKPDHECDLQVPARAANAPTPP